MSRDRSHAVLRREKSRRRLDFRRTQSRHQFSRRDLENLAVGQKEGAHLEQVCSPEPSAKARLEVAR